MTDASDSIETSLRSEDQQAIADYFASETYRRRRTWRKATRPAPDHPVWPNPALSPKSSFWMGLCGMSVMLLVVGNVAPILGGMVRGVMDAGDHYVVFAVLDQTVMFPALICFTFAVVTPMFWYGSVLMRFGLALILIVPGCLGFLRSSAWLDPPDRFWLTFTTVMLAMFVVIGVVAVLVQMWSHWTLSHSRPVGPRLDRSKTRYIMELTGVAAIGFATLVSIDTDDLTETLLFFIALALLSSVAVLGMLIGFLRTGGRSYFAAAVSALFAFSGSVIYSGMLAFQEFGWDQLPDMLPEIMLLSIYGTVVMGASMWLCVAWLRSSGWACLHRQEERRLRNSDRHDPWKFWFR